MAAEAGAIAEWLPDAGEIFPPVVAAAIETGALAAAMLVPDPLLGDATWGGGSISFTGVRPDSNSRRTRFRSARMSAAFW
jgi:hypothetical protein